VATDPEVAVVIGDYSRRGFLTAALRSVRTQTLARERYELVVTKNYRDDALDRELVRDGATVLFDDEPQIGRWLLRAIRASRAPIVSLLDDDDEFEVDRLAHVVEVFRRFPDLAFYRNRVRVLDREGRPTPPASWRAHETDALFDELGPVHVAAGDDRALLDLARRAHPTFNSSTMAFRREILDGDIGEAFERTQLPDQFLYVAAALARRGVYLDDRRLTRFRYYRGSVTHEVAWFGRAETAFGEVARLASAKGTPDLAAWLGALSVHYGRMFRGSSLVERVAEGAPRPEVARRTSEYLRFLGRHPAERSLALATSAAAAYGLAYLAVPSLTARFARARLVARGLA
jgi:glycosyltransferase involved in cell wall biosynthesis